MHPRFVSIVLAECPEDEQKRVVVSEYTDDKLCACSKEEQGKEKGERIV